MGKMLLKLWLILGMSLVIHSSTFAQTVNGVRRATPEELLIANASNGNGNGSGNHQLRFLRSLKDLHEIEVSVGSRMLSAIANFNPTANPTEHNWFEIGQCIATRDQVLADIKAYNELLQVLWDSRNQLSATKLKPLQDKFIALNEKIKKSIDALPKQLQTSIKKTVFGLNLLSESRFSLSPANVADIFKQTEQLTSIYTNDINQDHFGRAFYRRIGLLTKFQFLHILGEIIVENNLTADELSYILRDLVHEKNGFKAYANQINSKLNYSDSGVHVGNFVKSEFIGTINLLTHELELNLDIFPRGIVNPERNAKGRFSREIAIDANDGIYNKKTMEAEALLKVAALRKVLLRY